MLRPNNFLTKLPENSDNLYSSLGVRDKFSCPSKPTGKIKFFYVSNFKKLLGWRKHIKALFILILYHLISF